MCDAAFNCSFCVRYVLINYLVYDMGLRHMGDAVISISEFGESCKPAIQSVLNNSEQFRALHIVQRGNDNGRIPLYKGWSEHLEQLKQRGLEPVWHTEFDASRVHIESELIVHIAPDVQILKGALDQLHMDGYAYAGVTSSLVMGKSSAWDTFVLGFLPVLLLWDTLRSWFNLGCYYRTCDLRAQTLERTYPRVVKLSAPRWWMWGIWTRIRRQVYGGYALLQIPDQDGTSFMLRTLQTHNHLGLNIRPWLYNWAYEYPSYDLNYTGLGVWSVFAFSIYYLACALPFWTVFIGGYRGYFWWLLVRDPLHPAWITLHTVHAALASWVAKMYLRFETPYAFTLHFVLYPLYFTMFPFMVVYARWFHVPQNKWVKKTD